MNGIIPDITITLVAKRTISEFLDTLIYKNYHAGTVCLETRVFFKPTDTHQLLHGRSMHPKHSCRGILESQLIRFKRICSNRLDFNHASYTLFKVLKNRGYSRSLFRALQHEVWYSNFSYPTGFSKRLRSEKAWPIINFFDPLSTKIMHFTRQKIVSLNIASSFKVISAFKIHRNLAKFLTRSRFQ